MSENLDTWLASGNLDELIREIDRRCEVADWEGVETVRRRSRAAIERGHQLWPAASYAEYRLALDATAQWAASVIIDGAGWMAPGPLAEVIAQQHSFDELSEHLEKAPPRRMVAGERVVRGEPVPGAELGGDLPGELAPWEPEYILATYSSQGGEFAAPDVRAPAHEVDCAGREAREVTDADTGALALSESVGHWRSQSEGIVRSAGVRGNHLDALAALGIGKARWSEATLAEVGGLLAWASADGGAHGRRRGTGVGRFELWWTLAVLTGVEDGWPTDPGAEAAELRYGLWLPTAAVTGWSCRVTVEDPLDGLAWALDASDAAITDQPAERTSGPNTRLV